MRGSDWALVSLILMACLGVIGKWLVDRAHMAKELSRSDPVPTGNLGYALQEAQANGQLVFLNFTAVTDTNAAINEHNVFNRPAVREWFRHYQRVDLYIDRVPDQFYSAEVRAQFDNSVERQEKDAAANWEFLHKAFGTAQEPYYVILKPLSDGKIQVIGAYDEGKIKDEKAFIRFLKEPLSADRK